MSKPLPDWVGWALCLASTTVPIVIYFVTR